jgi:hypothetical protein
LYADRFAAHWVRREARTRCLFPCPRSTFIDLPSAHRRLTMSSSFLRFSSSELLRPFSSPGLFRAEHHLPRFPSLFATSHARSNFTRRLSQSRLRSVLRFSQPLDGFLRARARRLVSSRCHVQGSICSRASLPAQPSLFIRRSFPLAVVAPSLRALAPAFTGTFALPRVVPLDFEAFIFARLAFRRLGYSPSPQPLPSSVSSPPGPLFFGVGPNLLRTFHS